MTSCSMACTWAGTAPRPSADVEDRVADQLAGAVVGDVAAPVGVHELGADGLGVDEDVLGLGPHAERVHVRVLEQEQVLARVRALDKRLLQHVRVPVADAPEPADAQLAPDVGSKLGRPVAGLDEPGPGRAGRPRRRPRRRRGGRRRGPACRPSGSRPPRSRRAR